MVPQLVNAREAKLMTGSINKTDELDAQELNQLQQSGTLPTVRIPPMQLRDGRELPRTRMVVVRHRTKLKNRMHSNLAKYRLKTVGELRDNLGSYHGTLVDFYEAEIVSFLWGTLELRSAAPKGRCPRLAAASTV